MQKWWTTSLSSRPSFPDIWKALSISIPRVVEKQKGIEKNDEATISIPRVPQERKNNWRPQWDYEDDIQRRQPRDWMTW